jgi:hypothetical protein
MKALTLFLMSLSMLAQGQEMAHKPGRFTKLVVSPKINLVLMQGNEEQVRIRYSGVDASRIQVRKNGNKLAIFLEDARVIDPRKRKPGDNDGPRVSRYHNAVVTAYVTYRELEKLQVRGAEEVTFNDSLDVRKFKLKAYGQTEINVPGIEASYFKASLYGQNILTIQHGQVDQQKFRLYGENKIDTRKVKSTDVAAVIYGEGRLRVAASHELLLTSFGEPQIELSGGGLVQKGIVFGRPDIRTRTQQ